MKAICILILVLLIGSVAAQGTKFNADSRFTEEQKKSLETGNARLTCNLSCAFSYGLAARKLIQLHDTENWDELIFEVVNLGYEKNLTYYYLGRAFEGKGNLDAAEKYYKLGLGTSQKCSYGRCEGLVFPDVISSRLLNLNKSSSSATNYISKPKSDFILPVGWTEKPVPTSLKNAGVEFVAMNTSIQAAFRYWTLDKESLVNIPSYIKKMPQVLASDLKGATFSEIEELEVNGNKAYRFEVTGIPADSKSEITYLVTLVEGSKYLVRSDAIIEAKDYPVFKDYLAKLVFGFRSDDLKNTRISSINSVPAVSDSQRQEADQLKAQLEEERRLRREEEARRKEAEDKARQSQEPNQVKPNIAPNVAMGKRIALVIGNAKYLSSPLRNPINDANDISSALKQSGFEVIDVRDANLQQMRSAVRTFGDRLLNSDVGLVYYSGHGIESKGRNYFIPVNTDIQRVDEIADQALDVSLILDKMTTAGKGVNILIVDACRDDPLTRSFRTTSKGLAAMDAPKGTIIAYATSPGKLASDGDPKARNSPYTKHLLAAMQVPNRPIEMVFKEVRRNVQNDTKNEQTPWENTSLSGEFYFRVQK